jgi:uncharacterized protein (TIGR02996 family)
MPDDQSLLALVIERPDDPDLRMVYADWLEETGELPRATFLRDQLALFHANPDDDELLARGTELRALGETLPADWVARVSHPPLAGTAWLGRDSMKKRLIMRFLTTGKLSYTQDDASRTFENGTWRQIGNVAIAETNNHYADYQGVVTGEALRGASHNVANFSWTWQLERTTDPELVEPTGSVIKTIYDNHSGARRGAKPRRRRVAKTPKKALAKTAAPKEPVARKPVKKPVAKKPVPKKAVPKKAVPKKVAPKKAAPKAAPKKPAKKRTLTKPAKRRSTRS